MIEELLYCRVASDTVDSACEVAVGSEYSSHGGTDASGDVCLPEWPAW